VGNKKKKKIFEMSIRSKRYTEMRERFVEKGNDKRLRMTSGGNIIKASLSSYCSIWEVCYLEDDVVKAC